ncbi:MAG: hypothetical protein Edafosvirus44_2 [Edafosvirus sp.]|uniref:Uncharacterized protein n=1 Tax=Edafosvirus sp. TaxID=2487765 RepID=A0A3G4ZVG3_9VIRU|nr:MAG: hypothetical protein Edafosvirus44_2 [Edafosvirus sp.]
MRLINKNHVEVIQKLALESFTKKELYHYKMIDKYFRQCPNNYVIKMLDIINGESEISLRILDWFVTRYACKRKIDFNIIANNEEVFDVHISYKAQLKAYKKRYFDPFRRRKKFIYYYDRTDKEKTLYTTIGQLNFFRWALSNNIIDYVEKNYQNIILAMNVSNKEEKKRKNLKLEGDSIDNSTINSDDSSYSDSESDSEKKKIKKNTIKISASKSTKEDEIKILLCFD